MVVAAAFAAFLVWAAGKLLLDATKNASGTGLILPAAGAMGTGVVVALVDRWGSGRDPTRTQMRKGVASLAVAVIVALLVYGVGVLHIPDRVGHEFRSITGFITGNESGTELLENTQVASAGGLTLKVISVKRTPHFTRVRAEMHNDTGGTVKMHLNGDLCAFTGGGKILHTDSLRSRGWSEDLAPGDHEKNTLVFHGHISASARRASLSFTEILGGPDSIKVSDIMLRRVG